MKNYLVILKHEFEANESSFLIKLRIDLEWDREAFSRLVAAMKVCCEKHSKKKVLDRWLANGFWYFGWFVKSWTMHPSFPRVHSKEYYQKAYERLDDLAYWFFFGESPYETGHGFEPL